MTIELSAEKPQPSADAYLLSRELVSGALLAGGLFWVAISVLLLFVPSREGSNTLAEQISGTVQQSLGDLTVTSGLLALLLLSGAFMMMQSRALIQALPKASALWVPGLLALAVQGFSAMNGALFVSSAFVVLGVLGLLFGGLWAGAPSSVSSVSMSTQDIEQAELPKRTEFSTGMEQAKGFVPEDPNPTIAGLVAQEPEELPESAKIYSLNTQEPNFPRLNPSASSDGERQSLGALEHTLRVDDSVSTPIVGSFREEPVMEVVEEVKPVTQEVYVDKDINDVPGSEPEKLAPFSLDDGVSIGDLESTMEMEVPSDLLEPEAEPDFELHRNASQDVINNLEKTLVLDRPPLFDPPSDRG